MSNNRIEKVNSLLEHEIGRIIQKEVFFSNDVLVTLTRVEATTNLIEAKVFISVLPENKFKEVIAILNNSVFDIQQKINKKLNMRPIPKIIFVPDKEIGRASRIEELLKKAKKDIE